MSPAPPPQGSACIVSHRDVRVTSRQAKNRRADHLVGIEHRPYCSEPAPHGVRHLDNGARAPRRAERSGRKPQARPVSSARSDRVSRRASLAANTLSGLKSRCTSPYPRPIPPGDPAPCPNDTTAVKGLSVERHPAEPDRRGQPGRSHPRGRLRRPRYVAAGALFLLVQGRLRPMDWVLRASARKVQTTRVKVELTSPPLAAASAHTTARPRLAACSQNELHSPSSSATSSASSYGSASRSVWRTTPTSPPCAPMPQAAHWPSSLRTGCERDRPTRPRGRARPLL